MREILRDQVWQGIGAIIAILALCITLYLERERLFGIQKTESSVVPTMVAEPTSPMPTVLPEPTVAMPTAAPTTTMVPVAMSEIAQTAIATMDAVPDIPKPLFPPAKINPMVGNWIGITEDGCPLTLSFANDGVPAIATIGFRDRRTGECFAISQIILSGLSQNNVYAGGGNVQFSGMKNVFRFVAVTELSNPYAMAGELTIIEPDTAPQSVEWSAQYDR